MTNDTLDRYNRENEARLHAALHNVTIVGDPHSAVLALLEALDAEQRAHELFGANTPKNGTNYAGYLAWKDARERLHLVRARFHITSATQRDNADESEVGA